MMKVRSACEEWIAMSFLLCHCLMLYTLVPVYPVVETIHGRPLFLFPFTFQAQEIYFMHLYKKNNKRIP